MRDIEFVVVGDSLILAQQQDGGEWDVTVRPLAKPKGADVSTRPYWIGTWTCSTAMVKDRLQIIRDFAAEVTSDQT